jgi:hypothetical protein
MQERLRKAWRDKHPETTVATVPHRGNEKFSAGDSNAHLEHHKNFYRSIREGAPLIEDATFGLRAAGPALLTNESYFKEKIVGWNPQTMTIA